MKMPEIKKSELTRSTPSDSKRAPSFQLQTSAGELRYTALVLPAELATAQRTDETALKATLLNLWGCRSGVLLAHVAEGLVWGKVTSAGITLAHEAFPAVGAHLSWERLLALRIFGAARELRIFRRRGQLQALLLEEVQPMESNPVPGSDPPDRALLSDVTVQTYAACGDRTYLLLGGSSLQDKSPSPAVDGFHLLQGRGGECHAPPVLSSIPGGVDVRHYYAQDPQTGQYRLLEHRYLLTLAKEEP